MDRKIYMATILALMSLLVGCGQKIYPELSDDAISIDFEEYIDEENDNEGYLTIVYNERTYLPYGTLGGKLHKDDIDKCIGYCVLDGQKDMEQRIYTLANDYECNYLMDYYVDSSIMNQPTFWRAIDTNGKEIFTPDFIESLEYKYWN